MFANRIARYYEPQPADAGPSALPAPPSGFVPAPPQLLPPVTVQGLTPAQLYEWAYKNARRAAHDRILELLRARMR